MLALPPVPGREPQSPTEKTIRDSITNGTWYAESNRAELITILKDVLKDANISWNTFSLEMWPADKYADLYANTFGTTDAQKQSYKQSINSNRLTGSSFLYGNTGAIIICIREGTLLQVLPSIMYALGTHDYAQINYTGYTIGFKVGATSLAGAIMEAYGIRVLREKYGFSGLTNISAFLNLAMLTNILTNPTASTNIWRMWAFTADEGYPNGDMPADKLIKAYFSLTSRGDPTSYMADLDKKAALLDKKAIENLIRWRPVNKELTPLPADTSQKIGSSASNLSLDLVISYQEFVAFPW
jgi:hypothetical protein